MRKIIVDEKYNNKKVIDFLLSQFDGLTSATVYKALRKKDIRINDKRISENISISSGDEIKVFIVDELLEKEMIVPIIYEDDNIVVFNKPSGMETTGDKSLTSYAQKMYDNNYIEPCHRLDRNTSGLVVFAKNETSLNILLDLFKNHNIEKHYVCVVIGVPKVKSDRLHAFLFKDAKKSTVYISDKKKTGYKPIITSYTVLKSDTEKNLSLLDVTIETGRTHQIRAHLSYIGYPILGDGKYGINSVNRKLKKDCQCLTSYSLRFSNLDNTPLSYLENKEIKLSSSPYHNLI